jgi:hypothetical protein
MSSSKPDFCLIQRLRCFPLLSPENVLRSETVHDQSTPIKLITRCPFQACEDSSDLRRMGFWGRSSARGLLVNKATQTHPSANLQNLDDVQPETTVTVSLMWAVLA